MTRTEPRRYSVHQIGITNMDARAEMRTLSRALRLEWRNTRPLPELIHTD